MSRFQKLSHLIWQRNHQVDPMSLFGEAPGKIDHHPFGATAALRRAHEFCDMHRGIGSIFRIYRHQGDQRQGYRERALSYP